MGLNVTLGYFMKSNSKDINVRLLSHSVLRRGHSTDKGYTGFVKLLKITRHLPILWRYNIWVRVKLQLCLLLYFGSCLIHYYNIENLKILKTVKIEIILF